MSVTRSTRTSLAALSLGLLLGFTTTVAPSCSAPPKRCNEANCAGCCDSTNQCQQGRAQDACGINGGTCAACATGQTCQRVLQDGGVDTSIGGRCTSPGGMGGGMMMGVGGGAAGNGGSMAGSGGGSGGSMMLTDGGCAANQCLNMTGGCSNISRNRCGKNTAMCVDCGAANQVCDFDAGACVACRGCVDFAGQCQAGNTDMGCGSNGNLCQGCGAGFSCVNGACQTMTSGCGSCADGCCSGSTCVRVIDQNNATCGRPGTQCTSCTGTCSTTTGMCSGGMGGAGGTFGGFDGSFSFDAGPSCDPSSPSCPTGFCCDTAARVCQTIGAATIIGGTYCGVAAGTSTCTVIPCGLVGGLLPNCNTTSGMCQQ